MGNLVETCDKLNDNVNNNQPEQYKQDKLDKVKSLVNGNETKINDQDGSVR